MRLSILSAALIAISATPLCAQQALTSAQAARLFTDQIKPLLKQKCLGCHGDGEKLEGDLDLRTRLAALRGGASEEPALVPGKPEKSRLYQAITWEDKYLQMPPKERNRLTAAQVKIFRQWITAGAPWPKQESGVRGQESGVRGQKWDSKDGVLIATSGGLSPDWTNRKYKPEDVWAYRPIRRYAVPSEGLDRSKINNPIDAFLARRLKEKGFGPASRADKLTLIRRATFDLTGLPPTLAEIDAFIKDDSPQAFATLLRRLLASERYGEQQARHWFDVVRYADTAGFSNDYERPNAWRYRDYVIRSFNHDKPYDRFIVEQLAGDELDPSDPEMLIAVGFLRMGPWEHTGMSVLAVTRQQYLDDVTHGVGVTFLGQALRCCKCHDHKFDPLPTRDYYRMQAVFAPVQFADHQAPYQPYENTRSFAETRPWIERRLRDANEKMASLKKKSQQLLAAYLKKRGVKNINELPPKERTNTRFFGLTALEKSLEKIYQKRIAYFQREMKRYEPLAFSVYNGPMVTPQYHRRAINPPPKDRRGPAQEIHILAGGSVQSPSEKVSPGVLSAVAGSNDAAAATAWNSIPSSTHGRRLALARWIASANNTFTARVIVNRIWQQHFGRGLVATPNNFGKMGSRPTHPELLDWLATWFVEHDWSIKRLHRLIMSSAAYQQAGSLPGIEQLRVVDSGNALLAYYRPRRLAAEEIRDSMLGITGELNREMGGPGVYPEINWEVARQPRHIMGSVAPAYQPSPKPRQRNRRTIYAFRYRTLPDPMLEVLNRPGADTSCERRDETTVTPQVFALFNGQFVHDRALALARRLEGISKTPRERIDHAFRLVYGRRVSDAERAACLAHVTKMTDHHRRRKPLRVKLPTKVTRSMVEELTGEPFEWDEELDLMKQYQSDWKPWDVGPETRGLAELCLVLLNSNEFMYVR